MTDSMRALAQTALELSERATEGPWFVNYIANALRSMRKVGQDAADLDGYAPDLNCPRDDDAVFIAFARTSLPKLAQHVLAVEEFFGEDPRHVIAKLEAALLQAFDERDKAQAWLAIACEALEHISVTDSSMYGLLADDALELIK